VIRLAMPGSPACMRPTYHVLAGAYSTVLVQTVARDAPAQGRVHDSQKIALLSANELLTCEVLTHCPFVGYITPLLAQPPVQGLVWPS
jgi:hypothetical protein